MTANCFITWDWGSDSPSSAQNLTWCKANNPHKHFMKQRLKHFHGLMFGNRVLLGERWRGNDVFSCSQFFLTLPIIHLTPVVNDRVPSVLMILIFTLPLQISLHLDELWVISHILIQFYLCSNFNNEHHLKAALENIYIGNIEQKVQD